MTQPSLPSTPADTYAAAFITIHKAVHGQINVPKLVRLGDLCAGLAVRRFEQFVTERDALFAELFGQHSTEIQKLGRTYMFRAGQCGRATSHNR